MLISPARRAAAYAIALGLALGLAASAQAQAQIYRVRLSLDLRNSKITSPVQVQLPAGMTNPDSDPCWGTSPSGKDGFLRGIVYPYNPAAGASPGNGYGWWDIYFSCPNNGLALDFFVQGSGLEYELAISVDYATQRLTYQLEQGVGDFDLEVVQAGPLKLTPSNSQPAPLDLRAR